MIFSCQNKKIKEKIEKMLFFVYKVPLWHDICRKCHKQTVAIDLSPDLQEGL